jgi:penicillin-insensitive murein endopeptidase
MKNSMRIFFLFTVLFIASCSGQTENTTPVIVEKEDVIPEKDRIQAYYELHNKENGKSKAMGSVSNGSLINGKLIPFSGKNYLYFDTTSYLNGRAFLHEDLLSVILKSYHDMETILPGRNFRVMECSNEHGGKIFPHRTHQNGLSVDFMTPLKRDEKPYYDLDTLGGRHYLLEFNNAGICSRDPKVSIDFETIALHILTLENTARKNGIKISKVIFKTELKDDLFATESGKKLLSKNIYFTKSLTPAINALHDDHYHIDFELIK